MLGTSGKAKTTSPGLSTFESPPKTTPPKLSEPLVVPKPSPEKLELSSMQGGPTTSQPQLVKPKPMPSSVKPFTELDVHPQVQEQGYPLGFSSMKDFRDKTRGIAENNRDGTVIVSGSSVTGYSYKKGTAFSSASDIDVGVMLPKESQTWGDVNRSGFPGSRTTQQRVEWHHQDGMGGRESGVKFFDGESEPDRSYIVRPHTPPRERRTPLDTDRPTAKEKAWAEERRQAKTSSKQGGYGGSGSTKKRTY